MSLLHIRRKNLRKSFGRTKEIFSLPDLIAVQSRAFNNFVQLDFLPEERSNAGLERVFRNVFPIEQGGRYSLNYCGYELGDWACLCGELVGIEKRYTWKSKSGKKTGVSRLSDDDIKAGHQYIRCVNCHTRVTIKMASSVDEYVYSGRSYAMPLKIKLQLITWDGSGDEDLRESEERQIKDIKEQSVFLCSLPVMVGVYEDEDGNVKVGDRGIFLINGIHRVVVSQIHRAPGVLFSVSKKSKGLVNVLYGARIIPSRGVWLDFEFDSAGLLHVKIDKKKKILATTFLQALGVKKQDILKHFYDLVKIKVEKGKFFVVVSASLAGTRVGTGLLAYLGAQEFKESNPSLVFKKGARLTTEMIDSLLAAGVKTLPISKETLIGRCSVATIENATTGEVVLGENSSIDLPTATYLAGMKSYSFEILGDILSGAAGTASLVNTLKHDSVSDFSTAAREVYSRIRPGDAPGSKMIEDYIKLVFFNSKYYDLSPVGRVRVNRKFQFDSSINDSTLRLEDVIATIKYLLRLQERGEGTVDDVDDLSNRCVRLVDELLQIQAYQGLSRIEKIAREKLRLEEGNSSRMPCDFINVKPMAAVLGSFFGTGQLSQFMDQTNPLSEMAHKRRLSALGQGGISRERATLDVRDVHPSHYGKICMIETPDGQNIGLISSLAIYSKVNELGFIEALYRPVKKGLVQNDVRSMDAFEEKGKIIAQAATKIAADGTFIDKKVLARKDGDFVYASPEEIDFIDVSTRQLVSVSTALIPFLEHDDASRALMGSNMQRQAVPLINPSAPLVGTGVERDVASAEGVCILAKNDGYVSYVSSDKILISVERRENASLENWIASSVESYDLKKYGKSSHSTWVHFRPVVRVGDIVRKGDLLADGPSVKNGELSLGNNICVAFMPWSGYNFEDAIVVSKRLVTDDVFTSVQLEEFVVEARDTKLGAEEITRDVPNISERELAILDEDGIVKVGTRIAPGDILVAKVTMKGDVQVSPEEKLLRAIFGDKSREVRDTSSRVPPGVHGTVVDVKVFSRGGARKDARYKEFAAKEAAKIEALFAVKVEALDQSFMLELSKALGLKNVKIQGQGFVEFVEKLEKDNPDLKKDLQVYKTLYADKIKVLNSQKKEDVAKLRRGDDLPAGVLKLVRVFIASKRPISVGDKMAGRHGNKGVVSKVVDVQDMPYLEDGTPVDIVLNPIGIPGRMNLGQLWETVLGMACNKLSKNVLNDIKGLSAKKAKEFLLPYVGSDILDSLTKEYGEDVIFDVARTIHQEGLKLATPVFDGANFEKDIMPMLEKQNLPASGKYDLYDGRTGEKFLYQVSVGVIYMMKLNHMADDKLHARSVGPYSLITQQPLGGKAQGGGQRLGEMEVWALFGYGAAHTLREMLTIKSDDITGRVKAFDSIVHGEEVGEPGLPESFNVLVKELQSLGLSIDLLQVNEERFCE